MNWAELCRKPQYFRGWSTTDLLGLCWIPGFCVLGSHIQNIKGIWISAVAGTAAGARHLGNIKGGDMGLGWEVEEKLQQDSDTCHMSFFSFWPHCRYGPGWSLLHVSPEAMWTLHKCVEVFWVWQLWWRNLAVLWYTQLFWEHREGLQWGSCSPLLARPDSGDFSPKNSPGTILSQSLDVACYSNYCSVIWGLPGSWHFPLFPLSNVIIEMYLFATSGRPNRCKGFGLQTEPEERRQSVLCEMWLVQWTCPTFCA